ncbi:class II aldolase/adducin family protein [Hydrogenophaga intermedia]|jgi:ribulose-5-phosphate 4-epimerase/fuculose-1-phosphate aldolase|uniref:class II aldolase/adducin family protein n=1 Tax=Hydrogenophaga intermedia TaxID=65786 RepID=UPI002043A257|nr:class II aldolase/adducin family protein [Hydrogenophaga intermedia]MCM3563644.1 class II aldolase/adducin family protein [Hydrogenophaga intermedia]
MNAALQTSTVLPPGMHPDEWAARLELAACYRVFAMLGWTEMIYNHITLRLPDSVSAGEKQFLINPFGLHYSEVTASNLVKIDLQGRVLDGSTHRVNPAGFVVHAAIHDGIAGAHCVMHTHTTAGVSVACLKDGLQQTNFYTAQLHGMVAYHDFEGITIHADEGPRLLQSIANKPAVILRNHGLLAWGATLPQTFAILWTLQRACEIQLATFSMGGPQAALPVSDAIAEKCTRDALQFNPNHGAGRDVFDALVRQVDRIDSSYRA